MRPNSKRQEVRLRKSKRGPAPRRHGRHAAPIPVAVPTVRSGVLPQLAAVETAADQEIRTVPCERSAQCIHVPPVIEVALFSKALEIGIFAQFSRSQCVEDTGLAQKRSMDKKPRSASTRKKCDQVGVRPDKTMPVPVDAKSGAGRDGSN